MHACHYLDSCFSIPHSVFFILVWFLCFYSFMVNPPGLLNFTIAESFGLSRAFGPGKWKTGGGGGYSCGRVCG